MSAVEFALLAPLYALLLAGVIEIGFEAAARSDVHEALRTGVQAAMSGIADPQEIEQLTADALPASTGYDVTVLQVYRCGSAVVEATRTSCGDGVPVQSYFTISVATVADGGLFGSSKNVDSVEVRVQ